MPNIPLLGVPPTRLSAPCSEILRQLLKEQGYNLLIETFIEALKDREGQIK
jgi:hypothetical protein